MTTNSTPDAGTLAQVHDALHELTPRTLYVVETGHPWAGDIAGVLMTWQGERLYTHVSSSAAHLRADLTERFGRDFKLKSRFGDFTVEYVALTDPIPDVLTEYVKPYTPEDDDS